MENHELGPREDDPGYWDGLQPQSPCPGCGEEDCQCDPLVIDREMTDGEEGEA